MKTVLVSGVIANKLKRGGAVWTRLNWILGLKKLGFKVYFVEQIRRDSCVDATRKVTSFADSENLKYFTSVMNELGLADSSALILEDGEEVAGLSFRDLVDIAASADLLVNISGHLTLRSLKNRTRCKMYLDLDPGFTQFWHATGYIDSQIEGHDYYFTIGENIGNADCSIPTSGIPWRKTRQPIVLEHWPASTEGNSERFTTIATWRGPFGPVEFNGKTFGLKVHEFRKFMELPSHVKANFEIALDIDTSDYKDRKSLEAYGWQIVDPHQAVPDPPSFRRYVQTSGAEFSVAQGMYVDTNSGWFSDRTVRYLASGKPALVQDTGFSSNYPVGAGLLTFRTIAEAIDGAERILADYPKHCGAARGIAEKYFDSDKVLTELTASVGASPQ